MPSETCIWLVNEPPLGVKDKGAKKLWRYCGKRAAYTHPVDRSPVCAEHARSTK